MTTRETIDRLLLSRSLIAPLRFKPATDRFAVAAHVLAAHDAVELAIAAICTERSVPGISDTRSMSLLEYLDVLKKHQHPDKDVRGKDYATKLNRVRVSLKHHGITPDKEQWSDVAEIVFGHILSWCNEYLRVDYAELDAVDLIQSASIRDVVLHARKDLQEDRFRECLEKLAEAISNSSLELFPAGLHVVVGQADAETALTVSAYGVDPGRFLALQRLLPFCGFLIPEPQWNKRQYGHEGNWNRQSAEFAYEETVNLLTRLQVATPYPTPALYEHVFKDIVVVKRDSPEVAMLQLGFDGWTEVEQFVVPKFAAGDRIDCKAKGSHSSLIPDPDQCSGDPDHSEFVVAMDAHHSKLSKNDGLYPTLIFKRADVEIEKETIYDEEDRQNS